MLGEVYWCYDISCEELYVVVSEFGYWDDIFCIGGKKRKYNEDWFD